MKLNRSSQKKSYPFKSVTHVYFTENNLDSRLEKEICSLKNHYPEAEISVIRKLKNITLFPESYTIYGLKHKNWKFFDIKLLNFFSWSMRAFIALKMLRPSIVHAHGLRALIVSVIFKRIFKCGLVFDARELESERNHHGFLKNFFLSFIERNLIPACDSILVVSPSIKKYYERKFPRKKIFLVVNACSKSEREGSDVLNLRDKLKISSDALVFMYIGGISQGRGIELYLKVFKNLPKNCHLVYMGDGSLKESVLEASKTLSNVHYLPPVPWDKVVNVAEQADYILRVAQVSSLSYKYALPNTFFQALSSRVPIIINEECEEMIEFCNDSEMCIPSKYDEQALCGLIKGLQKRSKKRDPLAPRLTWEFYESILLNSYSLCFEKPFK
ncbi:glycosyltransferase [Geitlerinema splendidum]|nr:glycosyltransferase [Geitlerinema splendidum]